MGGLTQTEDRVAVLVDCDNTTPAILDYSLRVVAQFGRVVIRRGYGNHATLGNKWQEALVSQAFTPHLQYQYAAGKNTADIALALDALEVMFDGRADTFCLVTSDSDFAYLCRKLRERGASVCVIGEKKAPAALRNASDSFFEWSPATLEPLAPPARKPAASKASGPVAATTSIELPAFLVEAISLLSGAAPEGKVSLGALGLYLKRTDSGFSPSRYGFTGLLDMLKAAQGLALKKEEGGHYTVKLAAHAPAGRPEVAGGER